jgi:hypothetical protein
MPVIGHLRRGSFNTDQLKRTTSTIKCERLTIYLNYFYRSAISLFAGKFTEKYSSIEISEP